MEIDKIIHEYVDGSLDVGKEDELFSMLSQNEELRTELKQQFAIKNAIRSDVKAFTPKAESTMKIFTTLGFEPPFVAPLPVAAPIVGTIVGTLGVLWSKFSPIITGSIVSAGLTAAALLYFLKPDIFVNENENKLNNSSAVYNNNIPMVESYSDDMPYNSLNYLIPAMNKKGNVNNTPKIVYKYVFVEKDANNSNKDLATNTEKTTQSVRFFEVSPTGIVPVSNEKIKKIFANSDFNANNLPSIHNSFSEYFVSGGEVGIGLEMRGNEAFYSDKENILPSNKQTFNNSTIAAYYRLSDEFSLGLEYRRENFYQKFQGWENSKLYTYEQQPNLETYNIAMRYLPEFAKFMVFSPFAQVSYGYASNAGNIGRLMIGTEVSLNTGWTFLIGGEYNMLSYNYQSYNNYSDKISLNAGLAFKF